MDNTILYLNGNENPIPIKIEEEKNLDSKIYWSFTEVCIAKNIESDNLHHSLQSNFIGSDHYLGDEGFVFNDHNLILSDFFLCVPEENFNGEILLNKLLKTPSIKGLPSLIISQKFNSISASDFRYLNPSCSHLICVSAQVINEDNFLRISIHKRLDLLFHNNLHCGFILYNPIRTLVRYDGDFIDPDKDIDISFLFKNVYTYFKFINLSNWSRLENQDEEIKKILLSIIEDLQNTNLSFEPAYALNRQCQILLSDYYGLNY